MSNSDNVLLSHGAENFDPDSLLEEEEQAETPGEIEEEDLAGLSSRPFPIVLSLKVHDFMNDEAVEVAGILQHMEFAYDKLSLQFTCLTPLAMKLAEMALDQRHSKFISCKIENGETVLFSSPEGKRLSALTNVQVENLTAETACIRVLFLRDEKNN